jgi:hypothetical protein
MTSAYFFLVIKIQFAFNYINQLKYFSIFQVFVSGRHHKKTPQSLAGPVFERIRFFTYSATLHAPQAV